MKTMIVISFCVILCGFVVFAGKMDISNPEALASYQAKQDTNYVSDAQYITAIEGANKFDDLKTAILRKAKSDKMKADKQKKAKEKSKTKEK